MIHLSRDGSIPKGWFIGPWDSEIPVPIGYANAGVDETHCHTEMYEIYLVAQGQSVALGGGQEVTLNAGDGLVVEPGELHTFTQNTSDYLHFVIQAPYVEGDNWDPSALAACRRGDEMERARGDDE